MGLVFFWKHYFIPGFTIPMILKSFFLIFNTLGFNNFYLCPREKKTQIF